MNRLLENVRDKVDQSCFKSQCKKEGCSASLKGLPASHALVDIDCDALQPPETGKRCDYVYLDEGEGPSRIAPIELKRGSVRAQEVKDQLQGGAAIAARWIPAHAAFQLIPVVVYGGSVHREELRRLRNAKISLHSRKAQPLLIRCAAPLKSALAKGTVS